MVGDQPHGPYNKYITFALYLGNEEAYQNTIRNIEDYKNIENHVFLKEIAESEFASNDYYIDMTQSKGKVFTKSGRYTIPKEFFTKNFGYVYFWVRLFWQDEDNQFTTQSGGCVRIIYEFIDDDTVRLSKN